jgi:hypothetical protein
LTQDDPTLCGLRDEVAKAIGAVGLERLRVKKDVIDGSVVDELLGVDYLFASLPLVEL